MTNDLIDFGNRLSRDFRDQHRVANDRMMDQNIAIANLLKERMDRWLPKADEPSPTMWPLSPASIELYKRWAEQDEREEEKRKKAAESCCYITSACLEDLGLSEDSSEMNAMKALTRDYILKSFKGKRDYVSYGRRAPAIVEAIRARADSRETWQGVYETLKKVAQAVVSGKHEQGYQLYKDLVLGLETRFANAAS